MPCESEVLRPAETADITVASLGLMADVSGVLFCAAERLLVVADLHLEKGSSFARRGMMLPPYDTAATVARLTAAIVRFRPRVVVALGDSFHDPQASTRLGTADRDALVALQRGRDWIWISGNHDPLPPRGLGGDTLTELRLRDATFRHEPQPGVQQGEIAGHLHPVVRVQARSGSVRRRCFLSDGTRCIMPAFGAYTGGLNTRDRAFAPLFGTRRIVAHVLGRERVYRIPHERCVGD